MVVMGIKLKNTDFDYPVVVNTMVENWVEYFTGRGRAYFELYLQRSEAFVPFIAPILKENGLPEDLVYLAMIESGFNTHARSRAKAVGPWQFMTFTGKRYGLKVNWWVDERRDIRRATVAAGNYLRTLHGYFGSWELAAAAYNAGEFKIARAIKRFGTRDFWAITRYRFLKPETRNYVPKLMAAAIIGKNREQFGFTGSADLAGPIDLNAMIAQENGAEQPPGMRVLSLSDANSPTVNAAKVAAPLSTKIELAEEEDEDAAEGSDSDVKLPAAVVRSADEAEVAESEGDDTDAKADEPEVAANKTVEAPSGPPTASPAPLGANAPMARAAITATRTPHVDRKGQLNAGDIAEFEVQSPADLLKIADAAGLTYQQVKSLNPQVLRWCTPPGTPFYRIKLPVAVADRFLTTYNHPAYPREVKFRTHTVRPGETIRGIARHHGINADPIRDLNGLGKHAEVRAGKTLLLPMPHDRSRSTASLDLRDDPPRKKSKRKKRFYSLKNKERQSARSYLKYGSS